MRPVLLELTGFGVFREPTRVDFGDVEFFALVGDTGAGKSTVLDAICFALYGNVPRYDDQRLVGAAMSLGANEARVRLTFEAGGVRYVVVRIVRRGAQNRVSTKEARLERLDDGAVLAGRESELRSEIERIVGLGFDDFTRCVVLPQGAFARFLHDKPADRQALLVRLLDLGIYGRLVQRANARAADHQRAVDRLAGQLSELPEADADQLASARERCQQLTVLGGLLDAAEPELAAHQAELEVAVRSTAQATTLLEALDRVRIPDELARRATRTDELATELAVAESDLAAAEARLADHESAGRDQPELARLEHLLEVHERIGRGDVVVAGRASDHAEATATAEMARELAARAAERWTDAAAQHEALRAQHRAHTIAVTLQPGEPCPVCEQIVERLPLPSAPAALEQAAAALADADRERHRAADALADAERVVVRTESAWASASERLAELRDEVAGSPPPEELAALRDAVLAARAEIEASRLAAREAGRKVAAVRAEHQRHAAAQRAVADEFHRQRDALVALAPPAPAPDLAAAWAELVTWSAARRADVDAERSAALARHEEAVAAARTRLAQLTEAVVRAGLDIPKPPSLAALRTAVVRAEADERRRVEMLERSTERRAELVIEATVAEEARSVCHELARLLKTDRFQRWLVEATFHDLAHRASETLRRLSSGQFSLRIAGTTGEFTVVDHLAADEERSVRTLSGGETFQASLALALALSDHVMEVANTRGHHRLESIFLDEGFGTLDPATLDTVASTIETLGTDGRMVGIVTHVVELAERVPVRFRVTKGARGSVISKETS